MHFNTIIASTFAAASLVTASPRANPMPNQLAKMSLNQAFGLVGRQDAGYAPTQHDCGPGDTCAVACGADHAQCPSSDGDIHCFIPAAQKCCQADGLGNSCDNGYFCTSNAQGTWCCPDGLSLTDCAARYGVSSLTSEVASATTPPTSDVTSSASSIESVVTSSEKSSSVSIASESADTLPPSTLTGATAYSTTYSTKTSCSGCAHPTDTSLPNGTVVTPEPPIQITNAANNLAHGVLPALAIAAGGLLFL